MTTVLGLRWPVELHDPPVGLRPLRFRDSRAWHEVRERNKDWLQPWEATVPPPENSHEMRFRQLVRLYSAQARSHEALTWVITYQDRLAGLLRVASIVWGSARSASIGYWVDGALAGRGIMPTAVAMASDHCFSTVGLHRIEVNIRPENEASLRVVEKLGFRDEGMRLRFLHIDGDWRDHRTFALTAEDLPEGGLLRRWKASKRPA
ncbi:GNAT family N-acetyltransferase [Phytoactinopolyspora limicola]|uniref:GNAT family N-acetyltransferase n=1 Tax=Phytoactinopolyspora limicola TaxID=2715536 RepID=UPI00140791F4|nr:GNAT family protein [Phytoactinopolyspora limicola]